MTAPNATLEAALVGHVQESDYLARFWSRVERTSTCWLWIGPLTYKGYGQFYTTVNDVKKTWVAHRLAYYLAGKTIPQGAVLDHICRVRNCVNPEHLRPLSNKENVLIGIGTSARNKRKTHCDNGHAYTPENTIWRSKGWRRCRTCWRSKVLCETCGQIVRYQHASRHRSGCHG